MSIIIAKIENNECLFISDTRVSIDNGDKTVTGDNKIRMSPNEGVLKIHILSHKICVAYAGNIKVATKIIHSFIIQKPQKIEEIVSYFQNQLKLENDNSEFILGIVFDNNIPVLYKISLNSIEEGNSFWIGEHKAFNEFQSYFIKSKFTNSILNNATEAFRQMVHNTELDTIGDFIISSYFNTRFNSFIYDLRAEAFGGFKTIEVKAGESVTLTEGTVEEGAFVVTNLISNNTGCPAICLYFSKGNIGFLYIPISVKNTNVNPHIITGTKTEVIEKIKQEFEIELIGMEINNGIFKFG